MSEQMIKDVLQLIAMTNVDSLGSIRYESMIISVLQLVVMTNVV